MGQPGATFNLQKLLDEAVTRGYEGLNVGIPFTVNKLNIPTGGIAKSMYYLILGPSRTGKSAFLYDQFIFNMADRIYDGKMKIEDVDIILYSLEIDRTIIAVKAAARFLFKRKKILTHVKKVLGVEGKTDPELYRILTKDEDVRRYISIIDQILDIFTYADPGIMHRYIKKKCESQSIIYGKDPEGKDLFRFKNPNKIVIAAIDHIALSSAGRKGDSTKDTIDVISKRVFVDLKRQYGVTPVTVQQINPQKSSDGNKKIVYGHADARDSKNTFQDCDVCISIGSPFHEEFKSVNYKGELYYIVPDETNNYMGLMDRFRMFGVEKDRYGTSNLLVPAAFAGEVGAFASIQEPADVRYEYYSFSEWQRL